MVEGFRVLVLESGVEGFWLGIGSPMEAQPAPAQPAEPAEPAALPLPEKQGEAYRSDLA